MHSYVKIVGNITIKELDEKGDVVNSVTYPNLVVTTGKAFIANRIRANTTPVISHIGVGTGTAGVVPSDTKLDVEIDRVPLSANTILDSAITYEATFGSANAVGTLSEAGLFNSSNTITSTMVCRTTFPAYVKSGGTSIAISWTLTVV